MKANRKTKRPPQQRKRALGPDGWFVLTAFEMVVAGCEFGGRGNGAQVIRHAIGAVRSALSTAGYNMGTGQ